MGQVVIPEEIRTRLGLQTGAQGSRDATYWAPATIYRIGQSRNFTGSNLSDAPHIKAAFERVAGAMAKRPNLGRGTGVSKIRIDRGLRCEIREGPFTLTTDMPEQAGGSGSAPTPGVYGRAALGSCLATGYMMYAAKLDVPFNGLEVQIHADYDDGALFGVADVPAGYSEVRYVVSVDSDAPEADILRVLDAAEAHSPYLDVFSRAQRCVREVRINAAEPTDHG